jgi:hypothetical protein
MQQSLDDVITSIDTVNDQIDVSATLPVSVTMDTNPVALARGLIYVMGDITWLALLGAWFLAAVLIIITLVAVRFIVAFWGVIKRFIDVIELIPGM